MSATFFITQKAAAQCGTPISTFPYNQDFEATNGGWVPGGSGSDWAWGAPAKATITGAASGAKCWITGGLTGSSYNDAEASWLQSPCFDFTGLQYPYISFNVFWETERRFDGASFQYSTDLGVTWTNVGTMADDVNCLNENWFNFSPIQYLGPLTSVREGWSGNIQPNSGGCQGGGGNGRWMAAKHTMPALAGKANVIFRFIFGAGTQCNAYDGFAVDDVIIDNAPPNNASFIFSCVNNTTVNFINTSDLCPATNWNFGDAASPNNTSTLPNPTHIFSGPGEYTITLNATGPDNAASTTTQKIYILGLTPSIISGNNCFGDNNGSASIAVTPAMAAPFFYSWNTVPAQTTAIATGLAGGSYTVTVNALNSCTSASTVVIPSPAALAHTVKITQPGCGLIGGSATITETGGTAPYTYSWSPSGGTAATASGLAPGNYIVTVTDNHLCTENINVTIATAAPPTLSITNKKDASCVGLSDGSATATVVGGGAPFNYSWNTVPVQNTATATKLAAGVYTVTVTDNNGCIATASVQILEPAAGACGEVYFPNAFTPNGDTKNDDFGPQGNLSAISNYLLLVYNRYGELVFYTRNPFTRWNGYYKSKLISGGFVWAATYIYKGIQNRSEQGVVTIIR